MSKDVITGLNINKGGSDPPLKPDEEYPEWLWKLATPEKTLGELRRTDSESLTYDDVSWWRF
jgi:large subunit ribosomal protein L54